MEADTVLPKDQASPQQQPYGSQYNQPQHHYGGQHSPNQVYGENIRPSQYGQSYQYQYQGYNNYKQYGDQKQVAPGQETEEDIARVSQQIRDVRQESVQSTRNALRVLQEAEESAGRTMQQLRQQSEQLGRIERNLDCSESTFAIHIKNPFASTKKKERALEEAKLKAAEELTQQDRIRKEEYDIKQRINATMCQGPYGRAPGGNNYSNNGLGGPGERSVYAFENTAEDNALEEEIDHNMDMMSGILGNLKNSAMAMNTEVNRQNERIADSSSQTTNVHLTVIHNIQVLQTNT
ncbi:Protein transport protein S9 plasma membrane t-SNARE [Mortierella sp. GBA30]|nr:Protein transport protein S9 plasma membrane t-SNARE [Mortierella sp. GBA30]